MSRFHFSSLLIPVLFFLFWIGCADDLRHRNLFDDGAGDVMLSFSIENISLTRAIDGMNPETAIDHAYLLFYPSDAVFETDVPVAAVRAEVSADNPFSLTFKMPLRLDPDTDYRLLAVANADKYAPEGFSDFKGYLDAWCSTSAEGREPLHLFHARPMLAGEIDCLPMRGGILNDGSFRFSRQDGAYKVSASLSFRRSVARIDVANLVKEGFQVEGIALCNWRDAVSVANADSQLGNRTGSVRGILSGDGNESDEASFIGMPSAEENGVQQLKESIYCFPSVTYESYTSDRESTALIIKARYGDDTESSYYRVNVGMSGSKSEVKENTKYLVTIQSVKGSGASTPEEAYASEESPISLSVVEDWDLDGCFDMDDNGNFLVLSTGRLEFDGNETGRKEVRVLTSKGLSWTAEYVADDATASAFSMTALSDISIAIGPTGKNNGDKDLSGRIIVSATTPGGGALSVEITVSQHPSAGSENPSIPEDMPFALVPLSYERVKIDHNARTIEIDGFDPDCYNSFIDVPVRVYIKDADTTYPTINVLSSLKWPLEGRISLEKSNKYYYCIESFSENGTKYVKTLEGQFCSDNNLSLNSYVLENDEVFFISVGAMGPDDPAIQRNLILSADDGVSISYSLIIKPRPTIIEDVVLSAEDGSLVLLQDRNIQNFSEANYSAYIGLDANGKKLQAYNYLMIPNFENYNDIGLTIPFKFLNEGSSFPEKKHSLYLGVFYKYVSSVYRDLTLDENVNKVSRLSWLKKYSYSGEMSRTSPFYEQEEGQYCYKNWVFPSNAIFESCVRKLRVSKMRMYFVSEVPVKSGNDFIPVCCYLPEHYSSSGVPSDDSYGYFTSEDGVTPNIILIPYYDGEYGNEKALIFTVDESTTNKRYYYGISRLVRPLTKEELDSYKHNYLGYGSKPHRLQLCHPDTYTSGSLGWIPE